MCPQLWVHRTFECVPLLTKFCHVQVCRMNSGLWEIWWKFDRPISDYIGSILFKDKINIPYQCNRYSLVREEKLLSTDSRSIYLLKSGRLFIYPTSQVYSNLLAWWLHILISRLHLHGTKTLFPWKWALSTNRKIGEAGGRKIIFDLSNKAVAIGTAPNRFLKGALFLRIDVCHPGTDM